MIFIQSKNVRRLLRHHGLAASILALSLSASVASSTPAERVRRAGHIPSRLIAQSSDLGRTVSSQKMHLAVALKLKDQAGLETFIQRVHNPHDSLYGKYLTPEQFADQYGPSVEDYNATVASLQKMGMKVVKTHANRMLIDVENPVADVESVFKVQMHNYKAANGRTFHSPNVEPYLSADFDHVDGISGLSNGGVHIKHLHRARGTNTQGSGASVGGLAPIDIRKAYSLDGLTQTGSGQTLGLIEFDGYLPSDIAKYESQYGITSPPVLSNILVDGYDGSANSGADEVTLDIELMVAVAPHAAKIYVYEGGNPADETQNEAIDVDVFNRVANDNLAKAVSDSWGYTEGTIAAATTNAENRALMQMAAQGQSVFAASGDNGAYDNGSSITVGDPASQPYMVAVGGTVMTIGAGSAWSSEVAWGNSSTQNGSGGGISTIWPMPAWQAGLASTGNLGLANAQSTNKMRLVPDVALHADPDSGYSMYIASSGGWQVIGGTSCAAPIWAAFAALINQQRAASGLGTLGFAIIPIYSIGMSSLYQSTFHDITSGTNLFYPAVSGFDLSTGWGSFVGGNLFQALAASSQPPGPPTGLSVVKVVKP